MFGEIYENTKYDSKLCLTYTSLFILRRFLFFSYFTVLERMYRDKRGIIIKILERQKNAKSNPKTSPLVFFYGDLKFNIPPMKNSKYASNES